MDRLSALVALRLKLDVRAVLGSRSSLLGLVLAVSLLGVLSALGTVLGFSLVRLLERSQPTLLMSGLSAAATALGLSWTLSPLLAGVVATETHDLGRLLHYPVALPTLVTASLACNVAQPMVLAQVPPAAAVAVALAGFSPRWPFAFTALLLALAFALASGQLVALALHALSRQRRWHDRALLVGIVLSLGLSLLPILLLGGAGGSLLRLLVALVERDAFALSPFSWGVRAAVYAGGAELPAFLAWAAASAAATGAVVTASAWLAGRLYRGELNLGEARRSRGRRAAMPLPGALGALIEKDLRVTWRDPRLKTLVFTGVVGPLLVLILLWQGRGTLSPGLLAFLAAFMGLGVLGANVFALERNGLALLFGFPVGRSALLVAKNLGTMALRLPGLLLVVAATLLVAGPWLLPAVAATVLLTQLVACSLDNYVSVLLPVPAPAAGRNPNAPISGTRGLGASLVVFAALLASLALSAPFIFLAWLPYLLGQPWLWTLTLPLAVAGAGGVYFMLVAGAARLVERREPDLVARAAGEE